MSLSDDMMEQERIQKLSMEMMEVVARTELPEQSTNRASADGSGRESPRKLNTFAHPTVSYACNFAHERSEYTKKSVGQLLS